MGTGRFYQDGEGDVQEEGRVVSQRRGTQVMVSSAPAIHEPTDSSWSKRPGAIMAILA
jgi:hypothetical protein